MAAARALLRRLGHVVVELARLGQLQEHGAEQAIVGVGHARRWPASTSLARRWYSSVTCSAARSSVGVELAAIALGHDDARHRRQGGDGQKRHRGEGNGQLRLQAHGGMTHTTRTRRAAHLPRQKVATSADLTLGVDGQDAVGRPRVERERDAEASPTGAWSRSATATSHRACARRGSRRSAAGRRSCAPCRILLAT